MNDLSWIKKYRPKEMKELIGQQTVSSKLNSNIVIIEELNNGMTTLAHAFIQSIQKK